MPTKSKSDTGERDLIHPLKKLLKKIKKVVDK